MALKDLWSQNMKSWYVFWGASEIIEFYSSKIQIQSWLVTLSPDLPTHDQSTKRNYG